MISPQLLIEGYTRGIFPMAMEDGEIGWFAPDPRGIIPLETFHVPHGLRRVLKQNPFEIRMNTAFAEVMRGCAEREETWISDEIMASYCELHRLGFAHSVECWREGELRGGLYGVALGDAFFGESMFSRERDASKVALHALVGRLRERGFTLLDVQWTTPHLESFGACEISRKDYEQRLAAGLKLDCRFAD